MKIIFHTPATAEGKAALAQQLARFHAQKAEQLLRHLPCPDDQKQELIDRIIGEADGVGT